MGTLTSAGGSGTVDYVTGEVSLTFTVAPAALETFSATAYDRINLKADMAWEGAAGNDFRLQLTGDPNFETKSTASFSRYVLEGAEAG